METNIIHLVYSHDGNKYYCCGTRDVNAFTTVNESVVVVVMAGVVFVVLVLVAIAMVTDTSGGCDSCFCRVYICGDDGKTPMVSVLV